jgi:hypothetical protein
MRLAWHVIAELLWMIQTGWSLVVSRAGLGVSSGCKRSAISVFAAAKEEEDAIHGGTATLMEHLAR